MSKITPITIPWNPISTYTIQDDGQTKYSRTLGPNIAYTFMKTQCIDISGMSTTNASGKKNWRFLDFIKSTDAFLPKLPISFVATPISDAPSYLTTKITYDKDELTVDIFIWDAQGSALPYLNFS